MTKILFNKEGDPKMWVGSRTFGWSKNVPSVNVKGRDVSDTFFLARQGNRKPLEFVSWGENNRFPEDAVHTIESTNVLQTGLNFKARVAYGQGVLPFEYGGFDDKGNEVLKAVQDKELVGYLRGYSCRRSVQGLLRDVYRFGNAYAVFIFSDDGSRILSVETMNARHCRMSKSKRHLLVYPDFDMRMPGSTADEGVTLIPVLDENDPWLDLDCMRKLGMLGKGGVRRIAFPRIGSFFSNEDYYAHPDWYSAKVSGWIDVAHKVPQFLTFAYQNAMSMMWQVNIPNSYFDEHFPKKDYLNNMEQRKQDIQMWYDCLEESLCGEENAMKAVMTTYEGSGTTGKGDEKIEFVRLKGEVDANEQLSTSAAANSEILFSLMVNPSVMGAGMPGGAYAGNAGSGSDIRESALISIVLAHIEKEQVLDPVEMMLHFNGYEGVELRFRRTILTTLNTGNAVEEGVE